MNEQRGWDRKHSSPAAEPGTLPSPIQRRDGAWWGGGPRGKACPNSARHTPSHLGSQGGGRSQAPPQYSEAQEACDFQGWLGMQAVSSCRASPGEAMTMGAPTGPEFAGHVCSPGLSLFHQLAGALLCVSGSPCPSHDAAVDFLEAGAGGFPEESQAAALCWQPLSSESWEGLPGPPWASPRCEALRQTQGLAAAAAPWKSSLLGQ